MQRIMQMVQHLFILMPMWKNIKAGGLLDCTALSVEKKAFLATKYHAR